MGDYSWITWLTGILVAVIGAVYGGISQVLKTKADSKAKDAETARQLAETEKIKVEMRQREIDNLFSYYRKAIEDIQRENQQVQKERQEDRMHLSSLKDEYAVCMEYNAHMREENAALKNDVATLQAEVHTLRG